MAPARFGWCIAAALDNCRFDSARLLNNVGQLMGQEPLPGRGAGGVLSASKDQVVTNGVRQRIHTVRGGRRIGVGMDADVAEIAPKPRLHDRTCCVVERLSS